jgi:hypothetical protein
MSTRMASEGACQVSNGVLGVAAALRWCCAAAHLLLQQLVPAIFIWPAYLAPCRVTARRPSVWATLSS